MFGSPVRVKRTPNSGPLPVAHPQFRGACVCCNASTTRVQQLAPPIATPVCEACADHAHGKRGAALAIPCAIGGAMLAAAGTAVHDHAAWFYTGGAALFAASFAITRTLTDRYRCSLPAGHYPGIELAVYIGATVLDTDNETLVEDLLARNPDAQRLERGRMPKATLVTRG